MAISAYKSVRTRKATKTKTAKSRATTVTTVAQPIPGRTDMVKNSDGAFVFDVGKWATLNRFLVLGSEGGTFYAKEQELTLKNTVNLAECIKEDGLRVVDTIVAVSDAGRAPKNTPALFALALAASSGDEVTRAYALSKLNSVARIPTHLFQFVQFLSQFRGFGPAVRKAVAGFYDQFDVDKLAYEVVKYQSRDGWSNADILRQMHFTSADPARQAVYRWILGLDLGVRKVAGSKDGKKEARRYGKVKATLPAICTAFDELKGETNPKKIAKAIATYNLTREMVPTEGLKHAEVWEALLPKMPLTALIRNLGNLSKAGLTDSASVKTIVGKLTDADYIKKSRIHPLNVLVALKTYASGKGLKGSGAWTPVQRIVDALDDTFYLAFDAVEPTGKTIVYGVDVSPSMTSAQIAGLPLMASEAAAVLALVSAKTEQDYYVMGFTSNFVDLKISPKMRLDDVLRKIGVSNFGGTDVSLPMKWAIDHKVDADAFVILTDSETNSGGHPSQMLKKFRQARNKPAAKQIVVGMTATNFTVADPKDPYTLDVVGLDTATPAVISEFIRS